MPRINELPSIVASDVDSDDLIILMADGVTSKISKSELSTLLGGGTTTELFTNLPGTTWDGSLKSKVLSGNTALTLTTTRNNGMIRIKQDGTGSRTLSINGQSLTINTAAGSTTLVSFLYDDVLTDFLFFVNTNAVVVAGGGGGGDVTAPTVVSMSIEDAAPDELVVTLNETANDTITPANADAAPLVNGVNPGLTGTPTIVGSVIRYFLAAPVAAGDTVTFSYAGFGGANAIQDLAGNKLANFSGVTVDNNVVGGGTDADAEDFFTVAGVASPRQARITTLVQALKAGANAWAEWEAIYIFEGDRVTNLKDRTQFALTEGGTGSVTYADAVGATVNGTNYLRTGLVPQTVMGSDNRTYFIYLRDHSGPCAMGASDGTGIDYIFADSGGDALFKLSAGDISLGAKTNPMDILVTIRDNGGGTTIKRGLLNGTVTYSPSAGVTGNAGAGGSNDMTLGCNNNTGSFLSNITGKIGMAAIGQGMSDTQLSESRAAFIAYLNDAGR